MLIISHLAVTAVKQFHFFLSLDYPNFNLLT